MEQGMAQNRDKRRAPGEIRDAIIEVLGQRDGTMSVKDIHAGVENSLGGSAPTSSVRSSLQLGASTRPARFDRPSRGQYRLRKKSK